MSGFVRKSVTMKEGAGAWINRLMPVQGFMNYDPFVLMDHFHIPPEAGFPPHPHRGFEVVTYLLGGTIRHEDNLGNKSTVSEGGAQHFSAGSGLVHSEMPGADKESHGLQLWINLPRREKGTAPSYQQIDAREFPQRPFDGGVVRTLAGEGSPLQLHTPVVYLDVEMTVPGKFCEPIPAEFRGFVFLLEGAIRLDGTLLAPEEAWFGEGLSQVEITADEPSRFLVCFGRPHHEPILQHGSFVD